MSQTKILVCCHTNDIFKSDDQFMPIHVGKELSDKELNIQADNTGDNISDKNKSYCELTGLYWAWKNLPKVDYIGLCHYRRYFDFSSKFSIQDAKNIPTGQFNNTNISNIDAAKILKNCDIILAKPKSYPYNLRIDYSVSHLSKDFFVLADVINDLYPDYSGTFVEMMEHNNELNHYNMFLSRYEVFDQYCNWLFTILAEVEKRINITEYNTFQKRIFGYMSERLLLVYVRKNNLKVHYYPIVFFNDSIPNNSNTLYLLKKIVKNITFTFSRRKIKENKSEFYISQKHLL